MAPVKPKDGKYKLGDSWDTDLEGIDESKYDVFTDQDKLEEARKKYGDYKWFVSYTIKEKDGKNVRSLSEYTIRFNKPAEDKVTLYYYLEGTAYQFPYDREEKDGKKKIQATLTVGDPPIWHYP